MTSNFSDRFRHIALSVPTSVSVITAGKGARLSAITIDSFLNVSYDPPTVAVAVYSGSRMMELLETVDEFTISVLSADQQAQAQWLGQPGQPQYGLLSGIQLADSQQGPPHLAGCVAYFSAQITTRVAVATHTIITAEVLATDYGTPRVTDTSQVANLRGCESGPTPGSTTDSGPHTGQSLQAWGVRAPLIRWNGEYGTYG